MTLELFVIVWLYLSGLIAIVLWDRSTALDAKHAPTWQWWLVVPLYPIGLPALCVSVATSVFVLTPLRRHLIRKNKAEWKANKVAGRPQPIRLRVADWIIKAIPK